MHQIANPNNSGADDSKTSSPEPPRMAAALTAVCVVGGLLGWWFRGSPWALPLNVIAYTAGSILPALAAMQSLSVGRLNVDLLMLIAAAGAAYLDQWSEGVVLLFLFSLSGTLEAYATYRTTRSIESLMKLRPREALRVQGDVEELVLIELLRINDLVRVKPGERFPVDGRVTDGESWADESTLTGESEPIVKRPGDSVFAGTINGAGSVLVKMTHLASDTTIERIVHLVHEAQATKTPTQKLVEAWQPPYVAAVLVAAALTIAGSYYFHNPDFYDAVYHGMTLLVAASPCAVVASAPSVLLSAIARAARLGVLFKGGHQLELLGAVQTIAFDKTGTLTHGKPVVTDVWTDQPHQADQVLRLAAAVEARSEHPLAATIVAEARSRNLDLPKVRDFESHTGHGVHGLVEDRWVGVGREGLFDSHEVSIPPSVAEAASNFRDNGQTAMLVIADGVAVGVIAVADQLRPEAPTAIAALKQLGIEHVVILTGDHQRVAHAVGKRAKADDVLAELMPDEKVRELKRLMAGHRLLAMVGDGVNDAPALATANVGIAMGGAGTDVALEIADVVLMRDDLRALPRAVWLGRLARRRVQQNVAFSFAVIATLIGSTFFGLPLWLGVIGHEGSTLLVVLNGVRTLWAKPPKFTQ